MKDQTLTKITCPNCGSSIEESQIKLQKKIIRCTYCNQTFKREESHDNREEITCQYNPPCLSDEECKRLIIKNMVCTDNVPVDIFDTLQIEAPVKKLYPFYVYHFNWSANWSAVCTTTEYYDVSEWDDTQKKWVKKQKSRTLHRDYNGTSAGDSLVVIPGGEEELTCNEVICNYYNTHDIADLLFTNTEEYENAPDGWTAIDADTSEEIYQEHGKEIKKFLESKISSIVSSDANIMAGSWLLSSYHYTYSHHQTSIPDCIYRPIWEMKCQYQDQTFDTAVDASRISFWQNLPQNTDQIKEIQELDRVINQDNTALWILGGSAGGGSLMFIIPGLVAEEGFFTFIGVLILLIGISLLIVAAVRTNSADSAKRKKLEILSSSIEKRKQAAIKRFGSDPELVAMLDD